MFFLFLSICLFCSVLFCCALLLGHLLGGQSEANSAGAFLLGLAGRDAVRSGGCALAQKIECAYVKTASPRFRSAPEPPGPPGHLCPFF